MADNNNELGAFLAGFIIGGLVGAAVALLTAPQSGEETRKYISDKSIELKNTAVEKAEQARSKAEAAAVEAQHYAEDIRSAARKCLKNKKPKSKKLFNANQKKLLKPPENLRHNLVPIFLCHRKGFASLTAAEPFLIPFSCD